MIYALLALAGIVSAIIASVSGFGIGSLLTPTLASVVPMKLAVAAVSIPHAIATAHRLWLLRHHLDVKILRSFGLMSAVGGLAGALANTVLSSRPLEIVLAVLILFVGVGKLTGWAAAMRFTGPWAWIAGAVSGFLGGMVGNQGGLRAGAMMGLGVSRDAFVATATATGLIVDAARMPVYVATQWQALSTVWPHIAVMVVAVTIGTFTGMRLLKRIPEDKFVRVVAVLLIALAAWLLFR